MSQCNTDTHTDIDMQNLGKFIDDEKTIKNKKIVKEFTTDQLIFKSKLELYQEKKLAAEERCLMIEVLENALKVYRKERRNIFFNLVNYNNIYLLPHNNDAQLLAVQINNERITGKDLIKQNVESEALRLHLYCQHLISRATDYIWDIHSTPSQRNEFNILAVNSNNISRINQNQNRSINNTDTIDRIARINLPQITNNNPFGNCLFNGTSFYENNNNPEYF
ncbi:hypothetical protein C1645_827155 [Glomus cerebriforme]|uniref:Uncharacterized protein n=1 Tax=Glomus cerebriforme TaxID=658196 RepID=A0A397SY88_9GLOM|nr:hypothetical protein C1645_827155 [Glomus cerebriforme]